MEAAEGLSIPVNITIKIHPLENAEFYEQFEDHGVSISDGDLFEHLERSHLVVVPNSNVAFEGIIIGTPAIAFQPYPSILKPDIVESPIPICTNNDEISEWFAQLTSSEYNMLLNEQIEYITSHHQLEPNAEERIIKEIIEDR